MCVTLENIWTCVTLGIENSFGNLEFNLSLWKKENGHV